jgi:hypothetical protein
MDTFLPLAKGRVGGIFPLLSFCGITDRIEMTEESVFRLSPKNKNNFMLRGASGKEPDELLRMLRKHHGPINGTG